MPPTCLLPGGQEGLGGPPPCPPPCLGLAKPKEVHQTQEEHLSSDITHPRLRCPRSGPRVREPSPVCRPDHREVRMLPDAQAQAGQAAGPLPNGQADSG